jgi:hypothetical protein
VFALQEDNFVLSAIFCAIEEGNLEGLEKLLSMANIDVNQVPMLYIHRHFQIVRNISKHFFALHFPKTPHNNNA